MPSSQAISLQQAEVGLLSAAKHSSSLRSRLGLAQEGSRHCLISMGPREPQEMAWQRRGFWAALGLACTPVVAECGIPSDSVGERAEGRGEDMLASAREG